MVVRGRGLKKGVEQGVLSFLLLLLLLLRNSSRSKKEAQKKHSLSRAHLEARRGRVRREMREDAVADDLKERDRVVGRRRRVEHRDRGCVARVGRR